jgi:hypothetical protein
MIKLKTVTRPLKIFHAKKRRGKRDGRLNGFIAENRVNKIDSVSDTFSTDDNGATMGIIRVIAFGKAGFDTVTDPEKFIPRKAPTQPIDRVKGGFHGCNYH